MRGPFHRSLGSTDITYAIHLLSQKAWRRKPLFFEKKTKTKISQSTPEKNSQLYLECDRMGFQLKHGKPLVSVTAVTLGTVLRLGKSKTKRRADKRKCHSTRIPCLRKKIEHSRFPVVIPPPPQFHLTLGYILFCFSSYISKKRSFFFSLSNTSQFLEIAQHLNHKPYPTRS